MCQLCHKCVQVQTHMDYLSFHFGQKQRIRKKKKKTHQNMEARHPFCLESKLTVTDRPQADDRWPDGGGGT